MTLNITILGCGSSGGIPRPGLGWGVCDPNEPKNRRRRTSLLVERRGPNGVTRVLVDTSPDLREQLLDANVDWLDGVLYTHGHADHTHGIDDLRALVLYKRRRIDVYLDEATHADVTSKFRYCFETPPGGSYPPIVNAHRIAAGVPVVIDGQGGPIRAVPHLQTHGDIPSLGFRFADLAYCCDLNGMPDDSAASLAGLDVLIIDALRHTAHPSHLTLSEALQWIERLQPRRTFLTNLHADLDYQTLCRDLPLAIRPAYDGLSLDLAEQRLD